MLTQDIFSNYFHKDKYKVKLMLMTFGSRIGTKKVVYIGKWRAQILKCGGSCCSLYKSCTDDDS